MKNFFEKVKGGVVGVYAKLSKQNVELMNLVKENKEFLEATQALVKESTEAIGSLKTYASNETPAIKDAFTSVSESLESVEQSRSEMVAKLQEQFLGPLTTLTEEYKKLSTQMSADEKANKDLEKAKADLDKVKKKPAEKAKPGEAEGADAKIKAAQEKATKEREAVVKMTGEFTEAKVKVMKDALAKLIDLEDEFYKKAAEMIQSSKAKIAAINVQKEVEAQATQPAPK
nr:hypothetical protein [Candidatus Sigynarchaeota archaeon]